MNVFCLHLDDGEESLHDHEDGNGCKDNLREQDIYLPIANVARIMKNAIPQTGKVRVSFSHHHESWMLCWYFLFNNRPCYFAPRSQKMQRSASRSVWASSLVSSLQKPVSDVIRRSARPSTARTSCSPCPRWVLICMWSHSNFTCRSSERYGFTHTRTTTHACVSFMLV